MSTRKRKIGHFKARRDGAETRWHFRRITTIEMIEMETDLRAYREKSILLSLGVSRANLVIAAGNTGAALDDAAVKDLTSWRDHIPGAEDVMPLFEWLAALIVDVEGLDPSWAELDDEKRIEECEIFGPEKANEILAYITERSSISEIELGNSVSGSASSTDQTKPEPEGKPQTSPED